jgi:hypothetical protein
VLGSERAFRWGFVLMIVAVISVVGTAGASASKPTARPAAVRTTVLRAEYKGNYHFEDHFNSNGQSLNTEEFYSWDETVSDRIKVSRFGDVTVIHRTVSLVANGTTHQDGTNGNMPFKDDCTIQQLKVPGAIQPSIVIEPNGFTGATLTSYGASVGLPDLVGAELTVTGTSACNNIFAGSSALLSNPSTDGTVNPVFPNDPVSQRFKDAFLILPRTKIGRIKLVPVSVNQRASTSTESAKRYIHAVLTLGGKAGKIPPGTIHNTPEAVRDAALQGLRLTLSQAIYPCLTASTGAIVFGALGLAIGPIVGSTMVTVAAPACAQLIARLHSLVRVYDDPPVPRYRTVARVGRTRPPSLHFARCPRSPVSTARFCQHLHAVALAWLAALDHTTAVDATLATTVGRESAAAHAHNKTALARQRRAALALLPKLRAALRSETSAGQALARRLRSVHAHADIASSQTALALGIILTDLRRHHTNVGQVRRAAPAALRPRVVNALTLLAG